jgi:hypothetical protein
MTKIRAKTVETTNSVSVFIKTVPDQQKQKDSLAMIEIMERQSGFEAKMWGPAVVGFGSYHYKYESGHQGDAPLVGFSPRKAALVLYLFCEDGRKEELLKKFGKYKTGKSCIYIQKLEDINIEILEKLIVHSIKFLTARYS